MKATVLVLLALAFAGRAQFPDTFLGSIGVGNGPVDICISSNGLRAYTAVGFGFAAVIDIEGYDSFSLAGLVPIDGEPAAVQCDETGGMLYVADSENSLVHAVNTSTLAVEYSFPIQPGPVDMLLAEGVNRIFLTHSSGMITVIDTQTGFPSDLFWAGEALNGLCISPDGTFIVAPDNGSPQESVINPSSGSVNRITSGMDSRAAAVSPDGFRVFLSSTSWNVIGVVDTETFTMDTTISCEGSAPELLAAMPGLPYLYGTIPSENLLSVYNTVTLDLQGTVDVPGQPVNIAVHPDGERLFVVCGGDNKVRVYGFDPAGVEPSKTTFSLVPAVSPAVLPSVRVTAGEAGQINLRVHDLAGRIIRSENCVLGRGESREFAVTANSPGMLLVTATLRGETRRVSVLVLKP